MSLLGPRVRYVLRRVGLALFVILGSITVTFLITRLVPADPAARWAGPRATVEMIAAARERLGLDQPLYVQYVRYLGDLARGDLGVSFSTGRDIATDLGVLLPATLELIILATVIAFLIGIPVGVLGAARAGSIFDRVSRFVSVVGVSLPTFWLALLLQLLFFSELGWLPLSGRLSDTIALTNPVQSITGFYLLDTALTGNWVAFGDVARHLVLPTLTLAIYPAGLAIRMTRSAMADALGERYVLAARALGISERAILFRFALRNAILPTITVLGLSFAYSITGAFLVEVVYSWPGLGGYTATAVLNLDFPVVVATTLVVTIFYIVTNLIVDLVHARLDPRILS
ncbi:MAG TPA: ABC transporter permease [Desulfobacterales bacterium]|nr:ABC transporter permease [Desulfobacterales bacterium]